MLIKYPLFFIPSPVDELYRTGHLYYLILLFLFSLIFLPIFWYLRQQVDSFRFIDRLANFCSHPWAIYALAFPAALIEALFKTEGATGGWSRYAYFPFMFFGFLLAADDCFRDAIKKHRVSALILGLTFFIFIYLGGMGILIETYDIDPILGSDPASIIWRFLKGFNGWFVVLALLGWIDLSGKKKEVYKNAGGTQKSTSKKLSQFIRYANEAQLPIYVLHQTPIIIIGFFVVQWEIHNLARYFIISIPSLLITLTVYDLGIRRLRLTRALFGMKTKR